MKKREGEAGERSLLGGGSGGVTNNSLRPLLREKKRGRRSWGAVGIQRSSNASPMAEQLNQGR